MKFNSTKTIAAALLAALMVFSLPASAAFAGSDLRTAGAGADLAGVGTVAWTGTGNITILDGSSAAADMTPLGISHYLAATDFGFTIPADAPIVGIQAVVVRKASSAYDVSDNAVRLIKGGAVAGDSRAIPGDAWDAVAYETATYGGTSDLWGEVWSPADINASNFGVALSAANKDAVLNRTARVDRVQISVTYGDPTTTGVNCTGPVVYGSGTLCTVTVTRSVGLNTPGGSVSWSTDGSGTFSSGGVCSLSGSSGSGSCSVTYTPSAVGTGSHLITATYVGDDNFLGSSGDQALTVNPKPITVTADAKSKTYGDSDPALTYGYTGTLVDGDTFSGALTRAGGEDVGTHAIQQGSLTLGPNYDITYAGANLTISQRPITVTAVTDTKVYDGTTDSSGVPTITSGTLAFSQSATWTQSFDTKNVGSGKTLTPAGSVSDGNGGNNYDVTFVDDTTGEITARPITVTADDKSKVFGEDDPALTASVTSGTLASGENLTGELTREPGEDPGTYAILQGTLAAGSNYNMTFVPGTFTITELNQPPTNISLSPSSVRENRPAGTTVGTLTTTDANAGDTFTYSFCGGANDSSFTISGSALKTAAKFNFEAKKTYSICVHTDDGHGGTFEKTLTVSVLDFPETFRSQATYDGWVLESTETSNTGGSLNNTATWFTLGDDALKRQFRAFLSFNTAGLPDNAVITKATLKIHRSAVGGTNPFSTHQKLVIDIRTGPFSGNSALQLVDFNAAPTLAAAGTVGPTLKPGNWHWGSLTSTGMAKINKKGLTQLRLRFQLDDDNDAVADFLKFYSGNAATAADRPVLILEYTVP